MSEQITPNPSVPSQVVQQITFPQVVNNLGIIPTSYKDSMDYYQTLAWLCKYLEETVIPTLNQNGNAVQELQGLYIELNNYVAHYFDTLDVQEEINNKLDEMASTGELQELLSLQYDTLRQEVNENNQQIENQLDIINGRINEFTHLPSGSTSGDAELIDIRTGGNGVTYPTAGDSVRAQYTINHTEILNIENMYNKIELEGLNGRFLTYNQEQPIEYNTSSEDIHVSYQLFNPKETIILNSYITGTVPILCIFYDVDGNVISVIDNPFYNTQETTYQINKSFIVPDDTFYAKICYTSVNNEISYLSRSIESVENASVLDEIENNGAGNVYNVNWEIQQTGANEYKSYEIDCNKGDIIYISSQNTQYIPAMRVLNNDSVVFTLGTSNQTNFPMSIEYQAFEISEDNTKILVNVLEGQKIYKNVYNYTINALYNKVNTYIDVKVLDKDGNGDFTTFKSATEYTWTHPNSTIYVNAGEYDLAEEYGDTYLNNVPSTYDYNHSIGPEIGNNSHFIFSSGAKLTFNYNGENNNVVTFFSPINITGSCILENVTIECSNCRYCIHEDPPTVIQGVSKNLKIKYINANLKHNGNTLGTYRETCCIGAGCTTNSLSEILGGIFEVVNGIAAISYHHYARASGKDQSVLIQNSYIIGNVQTTDFGYNDSIINININNSSLSNSPIFGTHTEAIAFNNEIRI